MTPTPPRCFLEVPRTTIQKPKFPVIDAHNHLRFLQDPVKWHMDTSIGSIDDFVRRMDEVGVERMIDLDGYQNPYDGSFHTELTLEPHAQAHPDRFWIFTLVDLSDIDSPDFAQRMRDFIRTRRDNGVKGIKLHKSLGLRIKDASGRLVLPSDERLAPVWETAAELGMPVTIHTSDPVAFFEPVTPENERYVELGVHPSWSFHDPKFPRFAELLAAQETMLAQNRKTNFIIAHVGSYAENLREVSRMLRDHPNMYVDTAERIAELGRQPYSARAFLIENQDRVLYGTDLLPTPVNTQANYRFFETCDEYFEYNDWNEHNQGCWNIYGVGLPDDVLKKIYRANAEKLVLG